MSNEQDNREGRTDALKNIQARQRWELFHRAIAHAKQSNVSAMEDAVDEKATVAPAEAPVR